jgi:uncharacterized protein (UPF0147 family)
MAGRPKKTTTETTAKKTTTKAVEKEVKNESADLTALMEQMAEMQKQILALTKENETLQRETVADEEIDSDTDILVRSAYRGTLVLSTEPNGAGVKYEFGEFGEEQDIPFGDLKDICKNMRRFAQEGYFYIMNESAVKKLRLTSSYGRMLPFDDMAELENKPSDVVIELYKLASPLQKDEIVDLYLEKYRSGKEVDTNVLRCIGELIGRDLLER